MSENVFMVTERMTAYDAGPPPFSAQNRSGFTFSFAVTYRPEAVMASKERTVSAAGVEKSGRSVLRSLGDA